MTDTLVEQQIAVTLDYFRRTEAGDGPGIELFSPDVEVWFPRFGRTQGTESLGAIGAHVGAPEVRFCNAFEFSGISRETR